MRTHLNRELVRMPEGIRERDDAIAARISSAGIKMCIRDSYMRENHYAVLVIFENFLGRNIYKIPIPEELGEAPEYNPRSRCV